MKRLASFALTLTLCLTLFAPTSLAEFSDITDPKTQTAASLLQSLGIVAGYNDGKFRPNDKLTRAQFCKMAVLLSGLQEVTAYESYTIFPDVRADYWGRGYINAAVRAVKIIAGFPDGTFRPDTPIQYAQAVTILMRLLGYTDADVGLNWPRGYLDKAAQIGLTKGISLKDNDVIARGLGAQLFYNTIFTKTKEDEAFGDSLGIVEVSLIVLQRDGLGPDGLTRGLVTLGGDGFYPCRTALSVEEGARGKLLVDGDGYALSWAPDKQTKKDITVKEAGPMSVTGLDGSKVDNIPSAAVVYKDGEQGTWAGKEDGVWIDVGAGQNLRFFFNAAGAVDYIIWLAASAEGDVKVLSFEPTTNPHTALGIRSDARVFKNGVAASWADLRKWDVMVYNAGANTVNVTDFRITGVYEDAAPNREAPDVVTTLNGQTFEVLSAVRPKLAACKLGDAITYLFTPDGRVADVQPLGNAPVYQPGIVTGEKSVTLLNGVKLEGIVPDFASTYCEGTPVLAAQRERGKLSVKAIPAQNSAPLDLTAMKAGNAVIAPYAVFLDACGAGGRAAMTRRETLPDKISAGKVLYVRLDSGGRVDLVMLNDVTGDAWLYGFTSFARGQTEESEFGPLRLPDQVTVSGQSGEYSFEDADGITMGVSSQVCGVAVGARNKLTAIRACVRVNGVKRSDFSGNTALTVSGVSRPIPDGLRVYVQATKKYVTVAEARVYSNDFTVWLDKPASEGGNPRFIIAN